MLTLNKFFKPVRFLTFLGYKIKILGCISVERSMVFYHTGTINFIFLFLLF